MRDKFLHAAAGALIAAPVTWVGYPVHGVILAGVAGLAKEYLDRRGAGTPELADFIATLIGAVASAAMLAQAA